MHVLLNTVRGRVHLYDLGDVKVERVLEVFGLSDDHQVETPATTEVGDDDRIDRHRRQELFPRRLRRLMPSTTRTTQNHYY